MILNNHSEIIDYPIDINRFPLAQKCKFIKAVINENQYLYIPNRWFHLVLTDPNTVAISFDILEIDGNKENYFYNYYKNRIPFKKNGNKYKFDYNGFINSSLNSEFTVLHSNSHDCSPVIKNDDQQKYFKNNKLQNVLENRNNNEYLYVGSNDIPRHNNYKEITDYINFDEETRNKYVDNLFEYNFDYNFKDYDDNVYLKCDRSFWMTLDKGINSGLHYDDYGKFLYVLHGKKTVYLAPYTSKDNLYITTYDKAYTIN